MADLLNTIQLVVLCAMINNCFNLIASFVCFFSFFQRDTKNVTVQSANGIFVSEGSKISHRYQSVASSNYGSNVVSVNFKDPKYVSTIVNNWVNANTRGLVDKLISSG